MIGGGSGLVWSVFTNRNPGLFIVCGQYLGGRQNAKIVVGFNGIDDSGYVGYGHTGNLHRFRQQTDRQATLQKLFRRNETVPETAADYGFPATDRALTEGRPVDPDIKACGHIDFHDQGFDVNHGAGNIQLQNDIFQYVIVFFIGHDNQAVGGLVGRNPDFTGNNGGLLALGRTGLLGRQILQDFSELFRGGMFAIVNVDTAFAARRFFVDHGNQAFDSQTIHLTGQHDDGVGSFIGYHGNGFLRSSLALLAGRFENGRQ